MSVTRIICPSCGFVQIHCTCEETYEHPSTMYPPAITATTTGNTEVIFSRSADFGGIVWDTTVIQ